METVNCYRKAVVGVLMLRFVMKGVFSMRKKMKPRKDKKVFRRTAAKSKKININPTVFRGGIRL